MASFAVACLLLFVDLSIARARENVAQRAQNFRQRRADQAAPKVPQLNKRLGNESYRFYNDKTARMLDRMAFLIAKLTLDSLLH